MVRFWDEELEDGDHIQVLLNGKVIVEDLRITNAGTSIPMELAPGKNVITVKALSTGDSGPCTTGIAIQADAVIAGKAQTRSDDLQVGQTSELEIDFFPGQP